MAWYVAGSVAGGVVMGVTFGLLGEGADALFPRDNKVTALLVLGFGLVGLAFDLRLFGWRLPTIKRQVDDATAIRRARDGSDLRRIGVTQDLIGLVSPGTINLVDYRLKPGRWLLVSYYGTRTVSLVLAPEFHFRRHRIVSSQVSSMGSGLQPRWDFGRRMETVLAQLPRMDVESMITHRFPLSEAAEAYRFVDTRGTEP